MSSSYAPAIPLVAFLPGATAHWGVEDPAAEKGDDKAKHAAFMRACSVLQKRIALLVNLRMESLDRLAAGQRLAQMGKQR
jgi:arsenate reductase